MGKTKVFKKRLTRKNNKGITLIALVVTIIVLLILAGISISMLTGKNGVLNRANEARYRNIIAEFDEKVKLAEISLQASITQKSKTIPGYIATEENNFSILAGEVANDFNVTAIQGGTTANIKSTRIAKNKITTRSSGETRSGNAVKINMEGYTVGYYLDVKGNEKTDGEGYIVIWFTNNQLRATLNRDEAILNYNLKDVASNKSVNQAVLVAVIKIENYTSTVSQIGLTSSTDADDITKETFKDTTLNDKLGYTSNKKDSNALTVGEAYDDALISIGSKFTYTGDTQTEWIVFGKDENGDVLLTTKKAVTDKKFTLNYDAQHWLSYETDLHTHCSIYGNSSKGITSRSITLEDINRVTGYTEPALTNYTFGTEQDYENKKVDYYYPSLDGASNTTYPYWKKATSAEDSKTLTQIYSKAHEPYSYDSSEVSNGNMKYVAGLWDDDEYYCDDYDYVVASRSVRISSNNADFDVANVFYGFVSWQDIRHASLSSDSRNRDRWLYLLCSCPPRSHSTI